MAHSEPKRMNTFIFACSGASDVGALSDRTARTLNEEGKGKMFCSVGIGGKVDQILETTKKASVIIAIDGCPLDCMKHSLENAGFDDFSHIRMTDHGFEKGKTTVDDRSLTKARNIVLPLLK